jgi:hypothetical protein
MEAEGNLTLEDGIVEFETTSGEVCWLKPAR